MPDDLMQTRVAARSSELYGRRCALGAAWTATRVGGALIAFALVAAGCKRGGEETGAPAASGTLPAPVASGVAMPLDVVSRAVNPRQEPVYSGPAGSVRGVVTVTGDPAPAQPDVLAKIGEDCAPAREVYGHVFREGPGRTLADVLVAVTGYQGYVPAQHSIVELPASGCAWASRTIAVTFGQRIDVQAKDRKAYVPDLLGANMPAQLIALPGGASSSVYAQSPGRYALVDSLRIYSMADVLVLKYATHDVTGLDGKFQIERIPAGKVRVSALLPATGETVEREITIEPSRTAEVKFELPFDEKKYRARLAQSAKQGASPSGIPAPPSASASGSPPAPSAGAR